MGIVIRQSIKATVVNYIGAGIGFITTMFVVTKFLQPEEIGLTKVILEVALLISGLAHLGTPSAAMRFFPYFKNAQTKNNGFFFYLLVIPLIGFIIFSSLYILLKEPIIHFFGKNSALFGEYYYWVIPLTFFAHYWAIFEVYSNLSMRIVVPKFIREVALRILLLAVYLLFAYQFINLNGLVIGVVITYGLVMIMNFFYASHLGTISLHYKLSYIDKPLRVKILKYMGFLMIGALSTNIVGKLDLFMISSKMGLDYAGIYTIAFFMAAVIDIPARSITSISSPIAAAALKEGDFVFANKLYQKVALHQLITGSTIFLLIWINIDDIFSIMPNGEIYRTGKWVVFFIALSKLVEITLSFGGVLVSFSKYYYWGLYFTFFITGLTILSNSLLIPIWGVTGAAVATMLTCLLTYTIQQSIVVKKIKGNPYTWDMLKQVLVILLLLVIACFIPTWTSPWINVFFRTAIVLSVEVILLYKLRISHEINQIIDRILMIIRL